MNKLGRCEQGWMSRKLVDLWRTAGWVGGPRRTYANTPALSGDHDSTAGVSAGGREPDPWLYENEGKKSAPAGGAVARLGDAVAIFAEDDHGNRHLVGAGENDDDGRVVIGRGGQGVGIDNH